jgi:hypothetical protein
MSPKRFRTHSSTKCLTLLHLTITGRCIPNGMKKHRKQRRFVQFVQFVDRNADFRRLSKRNNYYKAIIFNKLKQPAKGEYVIINSHIISCLRIDGFSIVCFSYIYKMREVSISKLIALFVLLIKNTNFLSDVQYWFRLFLILSFIISFFIAIIFHFVTLELWILFMLFFGAG